MSGQCENAPTQAYANLTEYDDVAPYVAWETVNELCEELIAIAIDGTFIRYSPAPAPAPARGP